MAQTADLKSTESPVLFVALELSKDTWKLGITLDRVSKPRIRDVSARDLNGFLTEVEAAKSRFGHPKDAGVKTCYGAGRDGFWIHRFLIANGIENIIIDAASIEVDRRCYASHYPGRSGVGPVTYHGLFPGTGIA